MDSKKKRDSAGDKKPGLLDKDFPEEEVGRLKKACLGVDFGRTKLGDLVYFVEGTKGLSDIDHPKVKAYVRKYERPLEKAVMDAVKGGDFETLHELAEVVKKIRGRKEGPNGHELDNDFISACRLFAAEDRLPTKQELKRLTAILKAGAENKVNSLQKLRKKVEEIEESKTDDAWRALFRRFRVDVYSLETGRRSPDRMTDQQFFEPFLSLVKRWEDRWP
ncbi:MAG: hypothetical protein AAF514_05995 [Verrucomicrobiota bacterium]